MPTLASPESARALLDRVVDYAGLFPPAACPMSEAVAEYARAMAGPDAWMLGRFVLPAARLAEFRAAHLVAAPRSPWQLSAIVAADSAAEVDAVASFNGQAGAAAARVDAIESKPAHIDDVDALADRWPGVDVYVEVAAGDAPAPWLARVAARGLRAKIRTGGVTAEAFPTPAAVVAFLAAAVSTGVPFKATAGLHHALRGSYRLSYAPDAASAPMYGYLNLLFATAALRAGLDQAVAEEILVCADPSTLTFADAGARWRGREFPTALLRTTRAAHLVGFGSCSFREPAAEVRPFLGSRS
jgi:hypothetical protein